MKTNTLDYVLTAILLIITEKKVHSVIFYFCIFKAVELNYNTHDKELLTIFEAFCTWHDYLKRLELSIDVITDYKNPEYFFTIKIFSCYQAK